MNKDIDIDIIEQSKKIAAYTAVDEFIKDNMVVGIGSGSTITYAIQRLEERTKTEGLKVICIPSSFQSSHLILKSSLTIGDLERYPQIDVTIDGADEVDEHLNLMKGGGGCQTQEKIVAFNAKVYVIIADYRKQSKILGEKWKNGVPIEVIF
jgi:ribose 5-phosphate isomerase A